MGTDGGGTWMWVMALGITSPGPLLRPYANNALLSPSTERENNLPWLKFKENLNFKALASSLCS